MGLLKWRDNPEGLENYLRLFMKVDGEEIVKVKFLDSDTSLVHDSISLIQK